MRFPRFFHEPVFLGRAFLGRAFLGAGALAIAAACPTGTAAANPGSVYEFMPAPNIKLNRVYRVDRTTGEIIACQFALWKDTVGVTYCFPSGEGAIAQSAGEYGLVATQHTQEGGIFRVNYRTGDISMCYVLESERKVVCTAQSSPTGMNRVEKQTSQPVIEMENSATRPADPKP